jgi:hypothetical protein
VIWQRNVMGNWLEVCDGEKVGLEWERRKGVVLLV